MTTRDALEGVLESEGYGVTRALTLFYAVMLLHYMVPRPRGTQRCWEIHFAYHGCH